MKKDGDRAGLSRRATLALGLATALPSRAQKSYGPGVSDTEIKIGNILPYSGPASSYGTMGKALQGYFNKVNAQGGVNGRKLRLLSLDDGYNPAKTVEQARKLVEQEEVLFIGAVLGTATNLAIQKYMNARKVPQLFVQSGASRWNDPKAFPWTMGFQTSYQVEAAIHARHILQHQPNARIGVLYQNDDLGKDYLKGFLDALGDRAKAMVVAQLSYEFSDPTIDSQLVQLRAAGADTFFNVSTPKFAAMAIRRSAEMGWKPMHYLASVSASLQSVIKPAGIDNAQGVITATFMRDPSETAERDTPEVREFTSFMATYYPDGNPYETLNALAYSMGQLMEKVLQQAGEQLTRENVMRQAAALDLTLPMVRAGMRVKTSPSDYAPLEQLQMLRLKGDTYERFGPVLPS
ncbi:MAG: branched-chain amino acid ABC transporter substrate-binding protein [Variovorax paradoxus]|jgi:ABC-type branched-subunit amino acid transport system substrate-binding protein|nr:MAG: branched-chain amino acid ABC transporter substrate-binding protein [Variovorax paradoxus]PZQ07836.1 MAG: branched-chain amino acid ABC transporter substrate-binding protein [Variovorax paradoxus]